MEKYTLPGPDKETLLIQARALYAQQRIYNENWNGEDDTPPRPCTSPIGWFPEYRTPREWSRAASIRPPDSSSISSNDIFSNIDTEIRSEVPTDTLQNYSMIPMHSSVQSQTMINLRKHRLFRDTMTSCTNYRNSPRTDLTPLQSTEYQMNDIQPIIPIRCGNLQKAKVFNMQRVHSVHQPNSATPSRPVLPYHQDAPNNRDDGNISMTPHTNGTHCCSTPIQVENKTDKKTTTAQSRNLKHRARTADTPFRLRKTEMAGQINHLTNPMEQSYRELISQRVHATTSRARSQSALSSRRVASPMGRQELKLSKVSLSLVNFE